ncbi:MAG: RluA family pseudouridine synthase [Eubacteriales bacterium]|nr:RluA family pseudouridine synthase [Eubacteriales bacterium]
MENPEGARTRTVEASENGERLDTAVAALADVTRSAAARLIGDGAVTVNGQVHDKNYRLRAGDVLTVQPPQVQEATAVAQALPLDVIYEDVDLIVINKPVGMVVHPAAGNPDGTLVNALLWHCGESLSGVGGVIRPGIVHRIDKDTSGLLVVAKNDETHLALSAQLARHEIRRVYGAIAIGNFPEEHGTVDAPIGRHPVDRRKMAVLRAPSAHAKPAVTHWSVVARGEGDGTRFTLLRCELETGRTHQIRVHLSSVGHPLLGDPVYGGDRTRFETHHRDLIPGQLLHAAHLSFTHPRTGTEVQFECPLPDNFRRLNRILFGADIGI